VELTRTPVGVVELSHQGGTASQEQMENLMTKATSIAIIASMYVALFALGLLGYIFLAVSKDSLDTFRLIVGGALTLGVMFYALYKGIADIFALAEEK